MAIKPLALKATIGVLGVGGLGIIAKQAFSSEKKQEEAKTLSNKERLTNEGYTPLAKDSTKDRDWDAILNSYKEADKKLRFKDFDGKDTESENPKAKNTLKNKCEEALASSDDELLNKSKKWCVTPIKPVALLEKKGIKVLSTENGQEKPAWTKNLNNFKEAKQKDSNLRVLFEITEGADQDEANITKMQNKCKGFDEKTSHEKEFETNLKNIEDWCVDKTKQ